jgi:hypothetical protein
MEIKLASAPQKIVFLMNNMCIQISVGDLGNTKANLL